MSQADYVAMQDIISRYPRHVEGRIIQQGGVTFLRDNVHRWFLPPETLRTLLAAAERYWAAQAGT